MNFKISHRCTKYLGNDQENGSVPSCTQPYCLDGDRMYNTSRKVCGGKNRRDNVSLIQTLQVLEEKSAITLRKYREEKTNLEQIVHHLNCQMEGRRHKVPKESKESMILFKSLNFYFHCYNMNIFLVVYLTLLLSQLVCTRQLYPLFGQSGLHNLNVLELKTGITLQIVSEEQFKMFSISYRFNPLWKHH